MYRFSRFFVGMCLAFAVALAVAAPPRLTGQGQADKETLPYQAPGAPAPAESLPKPEPVAVTPAGETPPASVAPEPAAVATPEAKASTAVAKGTASDKPAQGKSAWAEFWARFFRRDPNGQAPQQTKKPHERLVNTREHHEEPYQLLSQADLHRFAAGQTDPWRVEASKVMCSMRQSIADYGHAEFRQGVGQPLIFALYVKHPPAGAGIAHVRSEAPRWSHYVADKDLGRLELQRDERAVTASSEWSRRLLLELSAGMQPVMRYWDAADASDDIEVLLSAINFRSSLALFHDCIGQLQRYDVQKVEQFVVNFNEDSSRLREEGIGQIKDALEVYRNDRRVSQIDLEVYTRRSAMERYDFRLATRRIRAVRDYFIQQGVEEGKLQIKIHTKSEAELKKLGYSPSDVLISLRYGKPAS